VKLSQYWRDVLGSASATDETCGSILNSLKTLNQAVSNTEQQRVAVVEARRHKCLDYCLPRFCWQHSKIRSGHCYTWSDRHTTKLAFSIENMPAFSTSSIRRFRITFTKDSGFFSIWVMSSYSKWKQTLHYKH